MTRRLTIQEKNRPHAIALASASDFVAAEAGEISPEAILQDPRFTLYCFDFEHQAALFTEADDPYAVDHAPFYYQGQFEHAVSLASMPLETFHQVASQIPSKELILVHSVGRCGSTLLSKVLEGIPSVHSLSEPDDLTRLAKAHRPGELTTEDTRALLESSIKWRGKPRQGPEAQTVAIKTRSEVLMLDDIFATSFPAASHLFIYRDAVSWMRSIIKAFPADRDMYDVERNRQMEAGWSNTLPLVEEYRREDTAMNPVQIRILAWITCMEGYLRLRQPGVRTLAMRYEDLTTNPKAILQEVFEFAGIHDADWQAIDAVLARDSQAGTIYDREERKKQPRELTPELEQDLRDMIATRPLLLRPDVIVPGTIALPV